MAAIPHVTAVEVLDGYTLRLTFDDGLTGDVGLSGLAKSGRVFEPLCNPEFFAKAYIDPRTRTVTWPGEIDLDPEGLHDEASKNRVPARRAKPSAVRTQHGVLRGLLRAATSAKGR
jgi:hypothetical protein